MIGYTIRLTVEIMEGLRRKLAKQNCLIHVPSSSPFHAVLNTNLF